MQEISAMVPLGKADVGRFCWLDLAATDADSAKNFYRKVFGWTSHEQLANGGSFTRLQLSDRDVGSIYQLRDAHRNHGVPSHWTPYVRVDDVKDTARRVTSCGGEVIIRPFALPGIARIALVLDSVGALVGLWETVEADRRPNGHG
jgi:uncharacterized protein